MSTNSSRVAARWVKQSAAIRAGEEVLAVRIKGEAVSNHIDDFLRDLIKSGKEINRVVEEAVKVVEEYYPGDRIHRGELEKQVLLHLSRRLWGDDKMAPLLAELIAHGKYVW